MAHEESLLTQMIESDAFHDEDGKVSGIARLAIDKGFNSLSSAQKRVLEPFLTHPCDGIRDPGGYPNDCQIILSESELEEAYEHQGYYGALLCQNCRDESDGYVIEKERFMRD